MPDGSTGLRYVIKWQPLGFAEQYSVSLLLDPLLYNCAKTDEGVKGGYARLQVVKIFRETLTLTHPHLASEATWFDHLSITQV